MVNVQRFKELQDLEDGKHLYSKTTKYISQEYKISATDKIAHKEDFDISKITLTVSKDGKSEKTAVIFRSTRRFAKKYPFCDVTVVSKDRKENTKTIVLSYLAGAISQNSLIKYLCE